MSNSADIHKCRTFQINLLSDLLPIDQKTKPTAPLSVVQNIIISASTVFTQNPPSATTDLNQQRRRRRREKPRRKSSHLIFPSSPRRHTINLSCPLQRQPKKSDNIESTPGVGPAKTKNGQGRDTNNNSNGPVVVGLGCTEKFELCGIFVHLKKKLKLFSDSPLASDATDHCFKSNI